MNQEEADKLVDALTRMGHYSREYGPKLNAAEDAINALIQASVTPDKPEQALPFKVDDRVRVARCGGSSDGFAFMVGSVGTVYKVDSETGHCMVRIDGQDPTGGGLGAPASFLELADGPAAGETVRVRIAVKMTSDGNWVAMGRRSDSDSLMKRELEDFFTVPAEVNFIEADIPLPTSVTVEGEVVS